MDFYPRTVSPFEIQWPHLVCFLFSPLLFVVIHYFPLITQIVCRLSPPCQIILSFIHSIVLTVSLSLFNMFAALPQWMAPQHLFISLNTRLQRIMAFLQCFISSKIWNLELWHIIFGVRKHGGPDGPLWHLRGVVEMSITFFLQIFNGG